MLLRGPGDDGAQKLLFLFVADLKMVKRKKGGSKKVGERTIKGMANAVSSDEGEADGQDMVSRKL